MLAICDVRRSRRETACQRVNDHYAEKAGAGSHRTGVAYKDSGDVLARRDIDAVLIATPTHHGGRP